MNRKKQITLNQIFTISLTLFALCLIGAVTWFFYRQQYTVLSGELQRHGRALAENLAYNSEYGLLFLDLDGLGKLVDGVVQDRDVQFAMIVNTQGVLVAEKALSSLPELQKKIQERVTEILELLKAGNDQPRPPTLYFTEHYEGLYHIFVPVFVPTVDVDVANQAMADALPSTSPSPDHPARRELLGLVVVGISLERVTTFLQEIQYQVLGLALFIVVLSIIVSRFLVNAISRPIETLAEGTRRIARGDLTQDVHIRTPGEIGELAESFNHMMHDLQASRLELELWAQTLENRVRERTHEIEEKNQRLTELIEKMKRIQEQLVHSEKMASLGQLVAGIAHEINNPVNFISANITPLKNYVNEIKTLITLYDQKCVLHEHARQEVQQYKAEVDFTFLIEDLDDLLDDMETGASRIKRIVQDLRNFSRLDEAELKVIDIHDSLNTTLNLLGHLYEKRITVHKQYGNIPPLECYAGQLNQVFMNILANAAQACADKGNVWITTHSDAAHTIISIRDDGKGIPEETLPKIFDPFFTTKDVGEGTGLGLSISYGIIEKHQGEIQVKSQVGVGTEFCIRLPQHLSQTLRKLRIENSQSSILHSQ